MTKLSNAATEVQARHQHAQEIDARITAKMDARIEEAKQWAAEEE